MDSRNQTQTEQASALRSTQHAARSAACTQHAAHSTAFTQHAARSTQHGFRPAQHAAHSTAFVQHAAHSTSFVRWVKFNAVGLIGISVQLGVLALLLRAAHTGYLLATALAVEAAILHNFCWHQCFTWRDRRARGWRPLLGSLLRFNLTAGLLSIGGNLLLMRVLTGAVGLDPLIANGLAIASCSIVNFLLSDRFAFAQQKFSAD